MKVRWLACATAVVAAACTSLPSPPAANPDAAAIEALAPGGKLRVGLYPGSPTNFIPAKDGAQPRGIAYELAKELASRAHVSFDPVVFPSNDKVQEAARAGSVDLVFTNATAARAQYLDFTAPVLAIEKSYIVPPRSAIRDATQLDRPEIRIGISRGSTTQGELAKLMKHAQIIPMDSLADGSRALGEGRLDAYASNKAILHQMSDSLPGSRVLPGSWGEESIAFGVPKGRPAALAYLEAFVKKARGEGVVQRAAERAGVRGLAVARSQ